MTRSEILNAAEECVCGARDIQYGSPERNFETIAGYAACGGELESGGL